MQRLLHRVMQRHFPGLQLQAIRELRLELNQLEREAVLALREAGVSWEDIAQPMGITRQALQKKAATWNDEAPPE